MTPLPINTATAYDAAHALLALHTGNVRVSTHYVVQVDHNTNKNDIDDSTNAALVLSGLLQTKQEFPQNLSENDVNGKPETSKGPVLKNGEVKTPNGPLACSTPTRKEKEKPSPEPAKKAVDMATQTIPVIISPIESAPGPISETAEINAFKATIEALKDTVRSLVAELEKYKTAEAAATTPNAKIFGYIRRRKSSGNNNSAPKRKCETSLKKSPLANETSDSTNVEMSELDVSEEVSEDYDVSGNKSEKKDMVSIGESNAMVPLRLLKQMEKVSHTVATRKLLTALFSRRVLATHSLTGKRSPAFPNKPAKKKLNPAIVKDIVQTVADRCRVPENLVRTIITTKCADESKMLRTRQENKKALNKSKKDTENVPPNSDDSDVSFDSESDE